MMIFDKLVTYSGVISRMILLACFRSGRFSRVSESRGKMKISWPTVLIDNILGFCYLLLLFSSVQISAPLLLLPWVSSILVVRLQHRLRPFWSLPTVSDLLRNHDELTFHWLGNCSSDADLFPSLTLF
ncbi:hypothetical protein BJX68DRAFT_17474 [Aspergillus pseudodeflectus]|uniref:Uncharacterized protein n=1 Tax=Aspergillus pseudodeflectus TaxID=176178 RepID=A0ABR4LD75_9EURO